MWIDRLMIDFLHTYILMTQIYFLEKALTSWDRTHSKKMNKTDKFKTNRIQILYKNRLRDKDFSNKSK